MILKSKDDFVTGIESSAGNYARGYYTIGKEYLGNVMDRVRKHFENMDICDGIIVNHSLCGGCMCVQIIHFFFYFFGKVRFGCVLPFCFFFFMLFFVCFCKNYMRICAL